MKTISKVFLSNLTLVVFAIAVFPGCSHRSDTISKNAIVRQANKQLEQMVLDQGVLTIRVGKYEANDSERALLRKLAAAGLVTYKVNRFVWWEKSKKTEKKAVTVTKYFYYLSYQDTEYRTVRTDDYEFCDHYVVDIALTEEGKKLLTDRLEAEIIEDKDLRQPEVDTSKYIWNQKDLSENWPVIENPFIEKKNVKEDVSSSKNSGKSTKEGKPEKPVASEMITRIDSLQYRAFNQLSFDSEVVNLLAYNTRVKKARNIQIFEQDGFKKCRAEVILETINVSDAGRIAYEVENGMRTVDTVLLKFFVDKGWVLCTDEGSEIQ